MSRPFVDASHFFRLVCTASAALSAACLALAAVSTAFAQQGLQVNEQNGLLSVQASNASATELAEMLSNQLGISVVVTGDTEARVNIDIIEEPLEKALAKLSPNHMLVRSSNQPSSAIVEVVLMMGEGGDPGNAGGGDDQFLPSGSPAEDIVVEDDQQPQEDPTLRDQNRSAMVREAAEAASSDLSGQAVENSGDSPPPESFDPVTGLPIDPVTGLPLE